MFSTVALRWVSACWVVVFVGSMEEEEEEIKEEEEEIEDRTLSDGEMSRKVLDGVGMYGVRMVGEEWGREVGL